MKEIKIVRKEIVPDVVLLVNMSSHIIRQWTILFVHNILIVHIGIIYAPPQPPPTTPVCILVMIKSHIVIVGMFQMVIHPFPHNVHLNIQDFHLIVVFLIIDTLNCILFLVTKESETKKSKAHIHQIKWWTYREKSEGIP